MSLTNDQITAKNFKEFYEAIRPYLNGGRFHSGFTPIGTIIAVMGTTAPTNYLACDGTAYNIADYPELAAYITGQFGSVDFFGGNGTTTFAVPDLRGEFLRGTGTNSHTNQGNGANVGVHQDATEVPNVFVNDFSVFGMYTRTTTTPAQNNGVENGDARISGNGFKQTNNTQGGQLSNVSASFGVRPTNTSVLYCIATKNFVMDASCHYSTDEQVIGTWIDGKPLYQKTYTIQKLVQNPGELTLSHGLTNYTVVGVDSTFVGTSDVKSQVLPNAWVSADGGSSVAMSQVTIRETDILVRIKNGELAELGNIYVTLRYTKTTD